MSVVVETRTFELSLHCTTCLWHTTGGEESLI